MKKSLVQLDINTFLHGTTSKTQVSGTQKLVLEVPLRIRKVEQGFSFSFFAQIFGIFDDFSKWTKIWQKMKNSLAYLTCLKLFFGVPQKLDFRYPIHHHW